MVTISDLRNQFLTLLVRYTPEERKDLFIIFAGEILHMSQQQLLFKRDEPVNEAISSKFQKVLEELELGRPYQQITGKADFFGTTFHVDDNVLIPRPETEELLEFAIQKIKDHYDLEEHLKIIDIGTGSGIIPIILKKNFPKAAVSAVDISEKALEIAKRNADFHQTKINLEKMDFLNEKLDCKFDIIISNPPYIGKEEFDEIEDMVKEFEPNIALFPLSHDPLIFYKKIAQEAQNVLSQNGMIFLEINQKFGMETLELFKSFTKSELIRDISGHHRFLFIKN